MRLDHLQAGVPIVSSAGKPTKEFMLKWEQLKQSAAAIIALSTIPEVSAVLDVIAANEGDLLARGATYWQALAPGAADDVLSSGGAGVVPTWVSFLSLLNAIGGSEGDLLVRGPAAWQVFAPGAANDVLTAAGAGALPTWDTLSALLDAATSNAEGSLLYRSATAWQALAPGPAHDVLASGGTGANPAWSTISALLDAVASSAQGAILYRSATAWQALAPGAVGQVLTSGGAGANPSWASGGGGGGSGLWAQAMSATPTQASTGLSTWVNQGPATASNVATGLLLYSPSAGGADVRALTVAAPTAPYTVTALVAAARVTNNYDGFGIGWYDGSSKLHLISITQNGLSFIEVSRWNSPTSFNGDDFDSANAVAPSTNYTNPIWLQIRDDGTNVHFRFGYDGVSFFELFSVAKTTAWLGTSGYSNLCLFVNPQASTNYVTLLSWAVGP